MSSTRSCYDKLSARLKEKKLKLIEEGKVEEWQLPAEVYKHCNYKNLMENKDRLMHCMLPGETKDVYSVLAKYAYYLNRVVDEAARVNMKDYRTLRKTLIRYASDQSGIVMNVCLG